jgi:TolA-binding protein
MHNNDEHYGAAAAAVHKMRAQVAELEGQLERLQELLNKLTIQEGDERYLEVARRILEHGGGEELIVAALKEAEYRGALLMQEAATEIAYPSGVVVRVASLDILAILRR